MMMLVYALLAGLWLGLTLHCSSLTRPAHFRDTLALRAVSSLKTALSVLGWGAVLTAFLGWLAVLDVDLLIVTPLHAGVLAGGVLAGIGAALCGRTPLTALAGLGGGHFVESLCTLIGCALGLLLLSSLDDLTQMLTRVPPHLNGTWFRVTLDESFLFQGGFLGQGCLGAVLLTLALWIPAPARREEISTQNTNSVDSPQISPSISEPDTLPKDTLVITLEGEEPLVVDTEDLLPDENFPYTQEEELPDEEPESPDV